MDQLISKIILKLIAWGELNLRPIRNKKGIEIVDLKKVLTKMLTVLTMAVQAQLMLQADKTLMELCNVLNNYLRKWKVCVNAKSLKWCISVNDVKQVKEYIYKC